MNRRQGRVKGVTGRIYRHDMSRDVRLDNIDHRRCDLQELQAFDEEGHSFAPLHQQTAMESAAAAMRAAAVRTWFQAVQTVRYLAHRVAPCSLDLSTAASASLRGTLKTIVTRKLPMR